MSRHDFVIESFDGGRPLQVGNGHFAFGMDVTGMQTFAAFNTMSDWGWASRPLPPGVKISDFEGQVWDTHGRPVRYPMPDPNHPAISEWLAGNPHRINLGRLGLEIDRRDGTLAVASDLHAVSQRLELWTGTVTSRFEIESVPVSVTTACHPSADVLAFHIESPLLREGRLRVFLACPGDSSAQFANEVGDWVHPDKLESIGEPVGRRADFVHHSGSDAYAVSIAWSGNAKWRDPDVVKPPSLEVVKAAYGAQDKWLDVTEFARRSIRDGRIELRADNSLGPDPVVGIGKNLHITYRVGGHERTEVIPENGLFFVDTAPERWRQTLEPDRSSDNWDVVCGFSSKAQPIRMPSAAQVFAASRQGWPAYWKRGGAIDLSGSTDPRWKELERRIVLSQYLMKVNEAGSAPPQESGLVNNGWFGRYHMEMAWWHATHWALWNRWSELDPILTIYSKLLAGAKKQAKSEGYKGARWPKCIGPGGREWPHEIHSLLIWQQPHPIFFAELDYRAHPTRATLEKWRPIVEATADFLSTYAFYDKSKGKYVLGPPLFVVSENTDPRTTQNPTFELSYWRFGLRVAQEWRERMGLPPRSDWQNVLDGLSPLPEQDGVFVLHEGVKDMWTKWVFEHPALTGVFGMLPGDGVDRATMRRTLDKVAESWDFNHTWGWDFPMLAMCAARLGEPDRAIDFLLHSSPGFQFDERGLATGGPFPYFPSNGGLLYAAALMAAGWDGGPKSASPGFPKDGKWKVRFEDLSPAP
ncbi:MAG: hypothetical protein P4L46_01315 [Fimbriimonas sp.]|nr:hypothetical protein [Fimbriimonas sp.]